MQWHHLPSGLLSLMLSGQRYRNQRKTDNAQSPPWQIEFDRWNLDRTTPDLTPGQHLALVNWHMLQRMKLRLLLTATVMLHWQMGVCVQLKLPHSVTGKMRWRTLPCQPADL
jgi:hypothetical protein